jgi:hypothetical protein
MFDLSLAGAVEELASITLGIPDSDLDRHWAWGAYDSEGVRFAYFRTYEELRELAAQTAHERSVHGPRMSTAQHILAQHHGAYRDLQAALLGVDEDTAGLAPAEGEWPVRRIVAHVVGAEMGFTVAVQYALERQRNGDGRPAKIPDEAWDSILGEEMASLEAILDGPLAGICRYHEALHRRNLQQFAGISEDELVTPSLYWEDTAMSLRFRLHRFDSHLRQHTIQVDKALDALTQPRSEAMRLLRLIYSVLAEAEGVAIGAGDIGQEMRRKAAATLSARATEIRAILD